MRDITIGQYYPVDSILHRLDPRVKLAATFIYIVTLFLFKNYGFILGAGVLVLAIAASKVPFGKLLKSLKAIYILLIFTAVLNIFLTQGEYVWQFGALHISKEGIELAVKTSIRLVCLMLGASLLTLTTTPNSLTDGLERSMAPLNKIHVPVHEIAMMMSIALRFIPILMEEADKIKKAQMARGADFENGSLMQRIKALVPLLIPLFVSAFRRANDLALAMEARCYHGGAGRTKMYPLNYQKRDYIVYLLLLLYLAASILICAFHIG